MGALGGHPEKLASPRGRGRPCSPRGDLARLGVQVVGGPGLTAPAHVGQAQPDNVHYNSNTYHFYPADFEYIRL